MKKCLTLLFLSFFSIALFSQSEYLKNESEIKDLSADIAEYFVKGEISAAFDELNKYWPLPQNEIDDIREQTIRYLNVIKDRFGDCISSEKIKEEQISDFAVRETYIVRYEYHAIRLISTFYKNEKGWVVNGFSWDDQYTEEFREK